MANPETFSPQSISDLDQEDLAAARRLQAECLASFWSASAWENVLSKRHIALKIEQDKGLAAVAVFSYVIDEAELESIFVAESFRNAGAAKALMQVAFDQLTVKGINTCFLEVDSTNTIAIKLYEKLGFIEYQTRLGYYKTRDGKHDALLMKKNLGEA